jgi:hypothetical protein
MKTQFVEKNNSLRVHGAEFDPAETIVALLARARNDPHLIPTPILSSAANYSMQFRFTSLFRLIAEYSLERLCAERCAYPMVSKDSTALAKRLLTLCAHDFVMYEDLMVPLAEAVIPRGTEASDSVFLDFIEDLPLVTLLGLIRFMTESPNLSRYLSPLDVLTTAVLKNTAGKSQSSNKLGVGTWTLYRLVIALVENDHRVEALDLFRKLFRFRRFPPAATLEIDTVAAPELGKIPTAFDAVLLTSIARACQLYGWNERNARVLRLLVARCGASASRDESDMASRILHNNIMDLIAEGTEKTLLNAVSLFKQCAENHIVQPPSPHVLESLYTALHRRNMHDTMHLLFNYVQYHTKVCNSRVGASAIDGEMRYEWPSYRYPHGEACLSLLDYLLTKLKAPKALRPFAVYHANQPHQLQDQHASIPHLIALYAKAGHVDEAMRIWSEYRIRQGAEMLVGNATAVISLVKSLMSQATGIGASNLAREQRRARRQDATRQKPFKASSSHEIQCADPVSAADYRARCHAAARQIASDFTHLNQPLSMAAHSMLTSIAHVNFLVGDLPKAFAALTAILDRRTIPDEHDIAVAIHGVARYDPARAASVLDNCLKRGVGIRKEAWTSVLKEALVMGDYALAEILLQGLNNTGIEIDTRIVDIVVRHGMDFTQASTEDVRDFLERSLTLLKRERQTCPGLTNLCIRRALEADLAQLAFKFWHALLRGKETDESYRSEHTSLRRAIATSLVKACARGHGGLTRAQCQKMCDSLVAREAWRHLSWDSK